MFKKEKTVIYYRNGKILGSKKLDVNLPYTDPFK